MNRLIISNGTKIEFKVQGFNSQRTSLTPTLVTSNLIKRQKS